MEALKPEGPAAEIGFSLGVAFSLTLAIRPTPAESFRVAKDGDGRGVRTRRVGSGWVVARAVCWCREIAISPRCLTDCFSCRSCARRSGGVAKGHKGLGGSGWESLDSDRGISGMFVRLFA